MSFHFNRNYDPDPWGKIRNFIDRLCSFQPVTPQMKMDVYSELYRYCCECVSRGVHSFGSRDDSDLQGNLYDDVQTCLRKKITHICQSIAEVHDEDKVRLYRKYWDQYKDISYMLNSACHYINRQIENNQVLNVTNTNDTIDVASEKTWEIFFFQPLLPLIAHACQNLIRMHRNDKSFVDVDPIRKTIEIFTNEHFNAKMKKILNIDSDSDIYQMYLEIEIIRDVEDFYHQQRTLVFESDSIVIYLTAVAEKLDEIINYHQRYLPAMTLQILSENLARLFISEDRLNMFLSESKTLLSAENYQELTDRYFIICRISMIKNLFIELIESHVHQVGCRRLKDNRNVHSNETQRYVETIGGICIEYRKIVQDRFNKDPYVLAALDAACRRLVNEYSIGGTNGKIITPPELLARYCDALLRKGSDVKQDGDIDDKIKQMMLVFNYLEDKDIFIQFYQRNFVKRLINHTNASNDDEESIISRLTNVCGLSYTSKLKQIFENVRLSQTLIEQYRTNNPSDSIDFSAMVFSSNVWPLSKLSDLILPFELETTFNKFTHLYTQQHNGRRLIWLHQHSNGEMQALFTDRRYLLQVSMYQLVVLLLFNKSHRWTIEQIEGETKMQRDLLIRTISSLLQSRLLTCSRMKKDVTEIDIDSKDNIEISTDFHSTKVRMDIRHLMKSTKQNDWEKFHRSIDEDRNMVIQAAIIRVMKSRGTLKHTLLMQEVIDQLKSRFKPKIRLIKKCIDILIEKEYLQRHSTDKDLLGYLA